MPDGPGGHGPLPGRAVCSVGQQIRTSRGPRPQAYRCRSRVAFPHTDIDIDILTSGEADAKEGGTKNNSSTPTKEQAQREGTTKNEAELISQLRRNARDVKDPIRTMAEENPPPPRENTGDAKN